MGSRRRQERRSPVVGAVFPKYERSGAYHWREMFGGLRERNPFLAARYRRVIHAAAVARPRSVLDIGCGDGVLACLLLQAGSRVVGVDAVPEALGCAREAGLAWSRAMKAGLAHRGGGGHVDLICASAEGLPFVRERFDLCVMADVIEHLEDPAAAVVEAARVVGRDGRFVVTTPVRGPRKWDPLHVHEFSGEELRGLLLDSFESVDIKYFSPVRVLSAYKWEVRGRWLGKHLVALLATLGLNAFCVGSRSPSGMAQMLAVARGPKKLAQDGTDDAGAAR